MSVLGGIRWKSSLSISMWIPFLSMVYFMKYLYESSPLKEYFPFTTVSSSGVPLFLTSSVSSRLTELLTKKLNHKIFHIVKSNALAQIHNISFFLSTCTCSRCRSVCIRRKWLRVDFLLAVDRSFPGWTQVVHTE